MSKKLKKEELINILKEIDSKLNRKIKITAIGGTALNLIGLKEFTFDIDFILEIADPLLKIDLINKISAEGIDTQIQNPGVIVMFKLPKDYLANALEDKKLNKQFSRIEIKILSPLDIIITKLSRFSAKDRTDILNILSKQKFTWQDIEERFNQFYKLFQGNKQKLMKNFIKFKKVYKEITQN